MNTQSHITGENIARYADVPFDNDNEPRRSFAEGLAWAVPAAVLMWAVAWALV